MASDGVADRILAKLFLADRAAIPESDRLDAFLNGLDPQEAAHPLAVWIRCKRADLDWTENLCDMVSRYFGLPPRPLYAQEPASHPAYAPAAAALEVRLRDQGGQDPAAPPPPPPSTSR